MANRQEHQAQFVPFMCYWPTHSSMTNAQQRWYFYWRDQVRNQAYPDTDLSYVFVHVYELINKIGVRDAVDGYEQLRALWLKYRERHRKLDNYLIDWLADYAILNGCLADPLYVYYEAVELRAAIREPDVLLPKFVNGSVARLPLDLIAEFEDYRIQRSKFYVGGHQGLIDEALPKALDCVNSRLRANEGAGVFERFRPERQRAIQRVPFQSAVYAGKAKQVTIATVFPYSQHAPLRSFLTAIVKHTENCLREIKDYKGRLRGYDLSPELRSLIEEFLRALATPPAPRQVIEVDLSRVEELSRASDQVRDMLLAGQETRQPTGITPEDAQDAILSEAELRRPEGTPDHLLTDLELVHKVLVRLSPDELCLLELLMQQGWVLDDTQIARDLPGVLIERATDHINGLALRFLGDIVLASEGTKRIVADDYRDELEFLLPKTSRSAKMMKQSEAPTEGVSEGWAEFARRLQDDQRKVLDAIMDKAAALDLIQKIAADKATMPEALIDSINELAQETVGDIIIDTNVIPPAVEEEDLEMVIKVLSMTIGGTSHGNG